MGRGSEFGFLNLFIEFSESVSAVDGPININTDMQNTETVLNVPVNEVSNEVHINVSSKSIDDISDEGNEDVETNHLMLLRKMDQKMKF